MLNSTEKITGILTQSTFSSDTPIASCRSQSVQRRGPRPGAGTVTTKIEVGYKPPPPAFQIGKAVLGEVSAKPNLP
jgi:hypothetical protein